MGNVYVRSGHVRNILTSATSTVNGSWHFKDAPKTAIQATVVGSGAVGATVVIEVSNDALFAVSTAVGTITLSGTVDSTDGFTTDAPWKYIRANVTAISGTSAAVTVTVSS